MRIATLATMAGLALLGTIVSAQSVTYDFDRSANFTNKAAEKIFKNYPGGGR